MIFILIFQICFIQIFIIKQNNYNFFVINFQILYAYIFKNDKFQRENCFIFDLTNLN